MPTGYNLSACKLCGAPVARRGDLSARGKCQTCAERRIRDNAVQLVAHRGPWFDHWRLRMAETFRYVLADSPQPER